MIFFVTGQQSALFQCDAITRFNQVVMVIAKGPNVLDLFPAYVLVVQVMDLQPKMDKAILFLASVPVIVQGPLSESAPMIGFQVNVPVPVAPK